MNSIEISAVHRQRAPERSKIVRNETLSSRSVPAADEEVTRILPPALNFPVDLGPGFISIPHTQVWLGNVGRTTLYALMYREVNPLPRPIRLGRRAVFPVDALVAWRESLIREQMARKDSGAT